MRKVFPIIKKKKKNTFKNSIFNILIIHYFYKEVNKKKKLLNQNYNVELRNFFLFYSLYVVHQINKKNIDCYYYYNLFLFLYQMAEILFNQILIN